MLMFFIVWLACDVVGLIFLVLGCFIEHHWKLKAVVKDLICDIGSILGFMVLAPIFSIIGLTYFLTALFQPLIDKVECKFDDIRERVLDWCEKE